MILFLDEIFGEIKVLIFFTFSINDSSVVTLVLSVFMAGVNALNELTLESISRSICFWMRISWVKSFTKGVVTEGRGLWCRYKIAIWEAIWWSLCKGCIVLSGVVCRASVSIVLTIIRIRERAGFGERVRANRVTFGIWSWPFCLWSWFNGSISSNRPIG